MKYLLLTTALLGMLSIALGAFGAHALKNTLTSENLQSFETAVKYQIFHVLLILVGYAIIGNIEVFAKWNLFTLLGIVLFSGSIYLLVLVPTIKSYIWWITPIGGLCLMVSWGWLAWLFFKNVANQN